MLLYVDYINKMQYNLKPSDCKHDRIYMLVKREVERRPDDNKLNVTILCAECQNVELVYERAHELYCDTCFEKLLANKSIVCYSRCGQCTELYTRYSHRQFCNRCIEFAERWVQGLYIKDK